MGSNKMRPLEKIAVRFGSRLGVIHEDTSKLPAQVDSAVYMLRLDIVEYVEQVIGPDDMSEAAQRLRAQLRRM